MKLIKDWKEEDRKAYGKKVMIVPHRLEETGLFTDERLAQMLDEHPNHLIDFQHIPDDAEYPDQQVSVDFTGASGADMIRAAKSTGRIWINVREVMNRHPEYRKVLDQMYDEVSEYTGNTDRRNMRSGILISSSTASTPYHADPTIANLWHIRGHKKIWVYPIDDKYMQPKSYESIILGEIDEDLPFDYAWDHDAIMGPADLTGGEFLSWPHRSPHRVQNVTYCVSVVAEYSTRQTIFVNSGVFSNGLMRRKFGMNPSWDDANNVEKVIKAASGFGLRRLGVRKKFRRKDIVRFRFDETVDGFVAPVETPYERTH